MKRMQTLFAYVFLIFSSIFTIFPMLFMIGLSFRTRQDIIREGVLALPGALHFENYIKAWEIGRFSTYYLNSVIISAISILGVVALAVLISYSMVYHKFWGKEIVNMLILIGLIIPFEIIIIPLFYNMKFAGLLGTRAPVYLTHIALNIPFSVFLLRGFIKDIPVSLVESVRMDGAKEITVLYRIIVPIIKPTLVTLVILIFMWTWNDFMLANIMLRDDDVRTLPLGLSYFQGKYSRDIPLTSAASTIIMAPVFLLYFIFRKHMIKGLTMGAIKE